MGFLRLGLAQLCILSLCSIAVPTARGQQPNGKPGEASSGTQSQATPFYLHDFHSKQVGLDCGACHVPSKPGSVVLQRPGHDQCTPCHQDDFNKNIKQQVCAQCHSTFPPSGSEDLLPYPRYKNVRPIVFEFSHANHVDPHGRVDARTGFRADCTYCHHFPANGAYATFGDHVVCSGCHSKTGMKPLLSEKSTTADCRGCHRPEAIENPSVNPDQRKLASYVTSGTYNQIQFSHADHFKNQLSYHLDCTTCHYEVASSTSLATLTLPKMADCVNCHDVSKNIASNYRMANCQVCHTSAPSEPGTATLTSIVKPAWHTEGFRLHHADEASRAGASCFICHMSVEPSASGQQQCFGCHQVMMPVSHSARWKDDVHGKYAALDRTTCSTCHMTDFCNRCHNQTPRSHFPLPQFKEGGHAQLAMLNERACFTCHTFANTCSECHVESFK
jgi:hypothetical protein